MSTYQFQLLSPSEVTAVNALLDQCSMIDGKATAGSLAQGKSNKQVDRGANTELIDQAAGIVMGAISNHKKMIDVMLPSRFTYPRFARYSVGDTYPDHTDNPIIRTQDQPIRTDISVTVFLSDPSSYDGGELVVKDNAGSAVAKLEAGYAFVYPSGHIHRVNPITRGMRSVAVIWCQSRIRREDQRDILDVLGTMSEDLQNRGDLTSAIQAEQAYGNLMRMWLDA